MSCPHGVPVIDCDECLAAQSHTASPSAPTPEKALRIEDLPRPPFTLKDQHGNPHTIFSVEPHHPFPLVGEWRSFSLKGEGNGAWAGVKLDMSVLLPKDVPAPTVIACPHDVPYPDPCLSCANEHLHAAADAPKPPAEQPRTWAIRGANTVCPHGKDLMVGCFDCAADTVARRAHFGKPATAEATQVGGDHYRKMKIQPMRFSMENGLDACQHTVIKYVARFRDKGGIADLEKAKHVIDLLIQFEKEKGAK